MEAVDWSKEPGFATICLSDGTEVSSVIEYDGRNLPTFENQCVARLTEIRDGFQSREDDILIYGYMKSGTHWIWEITRMIMEDTSIVSESVSKMHSFLENISLDSINALPSPRILSTHLMPSGLPPSLLSGSKVVVPIRNPKDTAVSLYHHLSAEKKGTNLRCGWDIFLKEVWFNRKLAFYATWMEFTSMVWSRCSNDENFYPIIYEHLLENPVEMIRDLGKFLGKDLSEERLREIAEATSFHNMKSKKTESEKMLESTFEAGYTMYRKGVRGDWQNHFTEEQSKEFDTKIKQLSDGDQSLRQVMQFFEK